MQTSQEHLVQEVFGGKFDAPIHMEHVGLDCRGVFASHWGR